MGRTKLQACLVYEFLSEQGGLEREIINHSNFLKDSGFEVTVLTCHFDKKILKLLPFDNIKIEALGKINFGNEILNLASCGIGFHNVKKYNPDLFLTYSFPANYLIRNKKAKRINYINHFLHAYHMSWKERVEWAAGTQGIKRWVSIVGSLFLGNWLRNLDKKLVAKNNLNFANSKFTKKRLDKLYKMNSIVSYPPLDPQFKPSKKKINEKFIFSSSRIIPDKKYEWLIKSLSKTKNKMPLYIAGTVEKNYKADLLKLANSKKVKLKFLGRLNTKQIIDYYTNAQLFAFPTPGEDFGLVPVESLACGTPVIVWGDGSGPTEQIINGVNGFHAKPYDLEDFAKKIDLAIDKKLKQKNRKKILKSTEKFSYKEIKKSFMKDVNKILN